jgi:hypothetical protein
LLLSRIGPGVGRKPPQAKINSIASSAPDGSSLVADNTADEEELDGPDNNLSI